MQTWQTVMLNSSDCWMVIIAPIELFLVSYRAHDFEQTGNKGVADILVKILEMQGCISVTKQYSSLSSRILPVPLFFLCHLVFPVRLSGQDLRWAPEWHSIFLPFWHVRAQDEQDSCQRAWALGTGVSKSQQRFKHNQTTSSRVEIPVVDWMLFSHKIHMRPQSPMLMVFRVGEFWR